jgi:hypothetical protein
MFVLYIKDKRQSQDKEVQIKYRERTEKKIPNGVAGDFFSKLPTEPCALGSTQPLEMSTRILLGVKTTGVVRVTTLPPL